MIEKITDSDEVIAIIIRATFKKEGIEFFTPDHFSQQVGYMNRPKGYYIPPHTHNIIDKKVTQTQEVLYIKSGKVRVLLYNTKHTLLCEKIVETGDLILLGKCGHAFEMLESTEIIEIKQGPYGGPEEKVNFEPLINLDA